MQTTQTIHTIHPGHRSSRTGSTRSTRRGSSYRTLTALEAAILAACVLSMLGVLLLGAHDDVRSDLATTRVRVQSTQTLWELAGEHPIEGMTTAQTVEHIKAMNGLSTSQLTAGQEIEVPAPVEFASAMAAR